MGKIIVSIILGLAVFVSFIGMTLRILHWEFEFLNGNSLLGIGMGLILVFYPIRFYLKKSKSYLDISKLLLVLFFVLNFLFTIYHLQYRNIIAFIGQLAFLNFIVAYIVHVFKREKGSSKTQILSSLLYGVAVVGVLLGATLKIFQWKSGTPILIIGLIAAIISFVLGMNKTKD